jgi:hypothetical protein
LYLTSNRSILIKTIIKSGKIMKHANNLEDLRHRLRELKDFYTNLLIYAVICVLSILVWLSTGMGTFWPIWVILGYGITVGLKAIKLGQIPGLNDFFPFLSDDWEEQQLQAAQAMDSKTNTPHSDASKEEEEQPLGI